jgi:hypothetical protein
MTITAKFGDHLSNGEVTPNYFWLELGVPATALYDASRDEDNAHSGEVRISVADSWGGPGLVGIGLKLLSFELLHDLGLYEIWTARVFMTGEAVLLRFQLKGIGQHDKDLVIEKLSARLRAILGEDIEFGGRPPLS